MKPANYPQFPVHIWEHFFQFTQTPRPSKQEARILGYLKQLAEECHCRWQTDAAGNLVIYVTATAGLEDRPTVVIQNHVDMVTVKTDDKDHDFSRDPLTLEISDGWLKADRTTLGADNGVGCAAALALMTDPDVAHPPLELLFTVDEETGLGGALNLDATMLSGSLMLNLDTEDWGELYIGCAGGRGWELKGRVERESQPAAGRGLRLTLRGLAGGHSGIQIHQQLGNAIKLMGQWLQDAGELGVRLSRFHSGVADNVIPREASIECWVPDSELEQLPLLNQRLLSRWQTYLPKADRAIEFELLEKEIETVLTLDSQAQWVQLLSLFPHGAQSYNLAQPADLVDLSINLAVVHLDTDMYLETSVRFFNEAEARPLFDTVLNLAARFKLECREILNYPGWVPQFDNPLLAKAKGVYQSLYGVEPEVKAIHAGLECGILKSKMGAVDIVSFGPNIRAAHSRPRNGWKLLR